MTPEELVQSFYKEKETLLELYFKSDSQTSVSSLIETLDLDRKGQEIIRQIINDVLRDSLYTILLGIEGEASIGGNQEAYKLLSKEDEELTGGEITSNAWEYFHNNKYQIDKGTSDFIAELYYKAEGGRETPAITGYRPQLKFDFEKMQTSGSQTFIERELVFPGDTVKAEINILSANYFENRLSEGMLFEFREGARIIGTGKIITIVNTKLRKEQTGNTV